MTIENLHEVAHKIVHDWPLLKKAEILLDVDKEDNYEIVILNADEDFIILEISTFVEASKWSEEKSPGQLNLLEDMWILAKALNALGVETVFPV